MPPIRRKRKSSGSGLGSRVSKLAPILRRLVGTQISKQISQNVRQIRGNRRLQKLRRARGTGPRRRFAGGSAHGKGTTILRASGRGRLIRTRPRITRAQVVHGQGLRRAGEGLRSAGGGLRASGGQLSGSEKNILRALL